MAPTLVLVMIVVRVGDISNLLPIGLEVLLLTAGIMMTHPVLRVGAIIITRKALGIIAREVAAQAVAPTHEAAAPAIRESETASEAILAERDEETQSLQGSRASCMDRNNSIDIQSSKRDSTHLNGNLRDMLDRLANKK